VSAGIIAEPNVKAIASNEAAEDMLYPSGLLEEGCSSYFNSGEFGIGRWQGREWGDLRKRERDIDRAIARVAHESIAP
jgi:hypothetical protein